MLFNSFGFILVFLPLTLLGYFLISRLTRSTIYSLGFLALASLVFYASWDLRFLPIILISIVINYVFGLSLGQSGKSGRWFKANRQNGRRLIFIAAIGYNLAALAFYKYTNFGLEIWNKMSGHSQPPLSLILPLGISFFTFTQIAYLADIFSGHPIEKNFIKYLLFVTYFPHLIAGPILHHSEMMPQFDSCLNRRFSVEKLALGFTIFAIGLFKKTVIADGFSHLVNPIFDSIGHTIVHSRDAWAAALSYTLQIYFDFSGYSDMAIGLSLLFGIKLPFNFDAPYKSRSIIEFWRRWHITLSRFLRDYVYIALGGNKYGRVKRYFNLLLTMLLGGFWHGAGWTYLAWGYLHGCYLVVNHGWRKILQKQPSLNRFSGTLIYALLSLFITQLALVVAWVYFRAATLRKAHRLLGMMFHFGGYRQATSLVPLSVTKLHWVLIIGVYLSCLILPNVRGVFDQWNPALKTYDNKEAWSLLRMPWKLNLVWAGLIALFFMASLFSILIVGDGSQFLYFQF